MSSKNADKIVLEGHTVFNHWEQQRNSNHFIFQSHASLPPKIKKLVYVYASVDLS